MFTELTIESFRGLRELRVPRLAQVNLIIGRNNTGKTSLLEAIEFLAAGGGPAALGRALFRRGETALFLPRDERRFADESPDYRHVFPGHRLEIGANLRVGGRNGAAVFASCEVSFWQGRDLDVGPPRHAEPPGAEFAASLEPAIALTFSSAAPERKKAVLVVRQDGTLALLKQL